MRTRARTRMQRLAWFVGLWALSVAAVTGAAYGLRALIGN
jgi:hypothetical protein